MKERRVGPSGDVAGLDLIEAFVEPSNLEDLLQQFREDGDKTALQAAYERLCYAAKPSLFGQRFIILSKALDKIRKNALLPSEITGYIKHQLHYKVDRQEDQIRIKPPDSTCYARKKAGLPTGELPRSPAYRKLEKRELPEGHISADDPVWINELDVDEFTREDYENLQLECDILECVANDPVEQRIVLMLREGHTRVEIAEATGKNRNQISDIIKTISRRLSHE